MKVFVKPHAPDSHELHLGLLGDFTGKRMERPSEMALHHCCAGPRCRRWKQVRMTPRLPPPTKPNKKSYLICVIQKLWVAGYKVSCRVAIVCWVQIVFRWQKRGPARGGCYPFRGEANAITTSRWSSLGHVEGGLYLSAVKFPKRSQVARFDMWRVSPAHVCTIIIVAESMFSIVEWMLLFQRQYGSQRSFGNFEGSRYNGLGRSLGFW